MPNVTVTAVDTATAMDEIWDQLGPDAMIVSTKKQHGKIVMEATTETASTATEPPQASAAGFGTLFTNQMIGKVPRRDPDSPPPVDSATQHNELASLRRHGRERLSHRGHRAERFVALRKLDWNGARQPDGARTQVAGSPRLLRERCAAGPVLHARVARAQCCTGRRSKRGDRSQRGDDRRGASRER